MGRQVEELARFVARVRCEDIPEPVRAHARLVLLDVDKLVNPEMLAQAADAAA